MTALVTLPKQTVLPKRGHWTYPGTGPAGETCGTCQHREWLRAHYKCGKNRKNWTRSPHTDIASTDPACRGWAEERAAA